MTAGGCGGGDRDPCGRAAAFWAGAQPRGRLAQQDYTLALRLRNRYLASETSSPWHKWRFITSIDAFTTYTDVLNVQSTPDQRDPS